MNFGISPTLAAFIKPLWPIAELVTVILYQPEGELSTIVLHLPGVRDGVRASGLVLLKGQWEQGKEISLVDLVGCS